MANTQNLFASDSSTRRLGGKTHGAGHASPVSIGVGSGTKSSGNGTNIPVPRAAQSIARAVLLQNKLMRLFPLRVHVDRA